VALNFSPDKLREHFHGLSAQRKAIDKKLEPLREELNDLVAGKGKHSKTTIAAGAKKEAELRTKIIDLQNELFPIENERGAVARALNGQTGVPE